eukprot:CAMPEP_0197032998 /NCGR_PEP_ID=MMETSP1384-20130603/11521_1 /TAXON_ID=29189 /ORGANISM="Ammonia sp." /LENGTH=963 /DNA_ID=CAMNT_0042462737 /DNA_START=64 /DNA_END=2955 /DNA_ORIENTATION=+
MSNEQEPQPIVTEPDDGKEEEFVDDFGLKQDKESTSFKENDRMVKTLTSSLDVVEAFPPQYVNDRRCTLAVSFANAMQSNSKDLIRTQSSLRQSMQNVMDVLAYAPAKFDNTEQENRWNVIHKCGDNIRDAVIQLMDAGAEFFGFLMILDFGLSYFHSSIINGKGTLDIAISKFAKAAKEFEEYQEKFTKEIAVVRKASKQSMSEISRTFGGEKLIKEAQEALEKHQKELFAALQELKKLEYEKVKELMPLNMEIAALKGDLEQYNLQEKFANGDIEDLQSEISNARSRAQAMNRQAESASNYSTSTTTRYRSGGWWWWRYSYSYSYTTTRHTGNKDRLQGIADRYKKLQQEAQNAKEAKQKIMEQARHDKVKAQGEIAAKQKALDAKKESHEKIIKEQDKEVQLAKQRYEAGLKIISDAVKKFGGTETSVVNFLKATQQLGPATMMVLQATKTMDVNIKRLGEMITSQCETVWSIKTYFQRPDVNLVNMIEPLREENFVTLGDLEMNEAEFEEEILPLVKAKGKVADRRKIKKICTDKKEIKKWKQSEKTLGQNNTANLMLQVPVLCIFFPSLHRRLKFAWNTLANFKKEDNKAILSTLNEEIKQLCDAETAKIAAIQFKQYESDTKAIKAREEKGDDESSDDVVRKSKKDKKQTKKKKKRSRDSSSDASDSDDVSESDSSDENKRRKEKKKSKKKKDKKKSKKDNKDKKKKRRKKAETSSSDEEEESDSDESSESEKARKLKKKKKSKKKKRKQSSDSEEDSDSDDDRKKPKKGKAKKKKKKKSSTKKESSDEESNTDDAPEAEAESDTDGDEAKSKKKKAKKTKQEKKKKKKKQKKKDSSDEESNADGASDADAGSKAGDSDSDSDSDGGNAKSEKKKSKKLVKQTFELVKVIDDDMVKCLNADFDKVKFEIDGDEWSEKLNKLLKKGKKQGVDVKLTVSSIGGDDGEKKYTIIDAYLDK